jgi:hypothetical protein
MDIPLSPKGVVSAFEQLGESARTTFLQALDVRGYLHAIKQGAAEYARRDEQKRLEEIAGLKERIKQLEAVNKALKFRPMTRSAQKEKKNRIRDLHENGWTAIEIAEQITAEGMSTSSDAVRQALCRQRQAK